MAAILFYASQEEHYRLEPPNGARPKWSGHERQLHSIEEPRSPGMGATVNRCGPGTDPDGMGDPATSLPTFQHVQQHRQSAGLPGNGTQVDCDFLC